MIFGPTTDKVYFMHIYHNWDEFYGISEMWSNYYMGKARQ